MSVRAASTNLNLHNNQNKAAPQAGGRNAGIDLLRGIAILLVVIHHIALRIPLMKTGLAVIFPAFFLKALNWDGGKAVTLFFVISGFLIADHTIGRWSALERMHWRSFTVRRVSRIFPCLFILLFVLSGLYELRVADFQFHQTGQSLPAAVSAALFMHLNVYEAQTGYLPANWDVLWSLSIEELFYAVFPIVCVLFARWPTMLGMGFGVLAFARPLAEWQITDATEIWQEKAYGPGLTAIAMGVFAAWLLHRLRPVALKRYAPFLGIAGALGLLLYLLNSQWVWVSLGYGAPLFFTLSCAVLLVALKMGWAEKTCKKLPVWPRKWGQMSYEIYLSHMFVVLPVVHLFNALGSNFTYGWLFYVPALVGAFYLGQVVARFISWPMDTWLKKKFHLSANVGFQKTIKN